MHCPICGQKLAEADCRRTNVDEVSCGGANRDREMVVCKCDFCGATSGVLTEVEEE